MRDSVSAAASEAGLEGAVQAAAEAGYAISAAELREAFAIDWGMRRARHLRDGAAVDSAASTVAVVQTPPSPT